MNNPFRLIFCNDTLRAIASMVVLISLAACGSGPNTDQNQPPASTPGPTTPTPDPTPAPDPAPDPTPTPNTGAKFVVDGGGPGGVTVSPDGLTASFTGGVFVGVRGTIPLTQGPNNFYYFEVQRSTENLSFGVTGTLPPSLPMSTTGDSYMGNYNQINTLPVSPSTVFGGRIGFEDVLGFAVDYRSQFPVIYVIGSSTTASTSCPTAGSSTDEPCVYGRAQLKDATGSINIYAYSGFDSNVHPTITLNTGNDLVHRPFAYPEAGVRSALRKAFYQGDRGFNMQWPSSTGSASVPTLTRTGTDRAVVQLGDTTPLRSSLAVTADPATATPVKWHDENGIERGIGASLQLSDSLLSALGAGDHTLIASVIDTATNRYAETKFQLTVDPSLSDLDDDGDGLTYSQEKTAGTDSASADTDGDGLSDGVEAGLGFNPALADTDGDGVRDGRQHASNNALPERVTLSKETGATPTSVGIVLSDDGLSAAFTSDLNQDCTQSRGAYTDPVYNNEICRKRAVRASYGVKPGEFRYFETRRLDTISPLFLLNLGHGVIVDNAQIDPFCCLTGPTPDPLTPPALALNSSANGISIRLAPPAGSYYPKTPTDPYHPASTVYYGFAVDYTGSNPLVYVVTRDSSGAMSVLDGAPLIEGVNYPAGHDVMPMLYGHPVADTTLSSAINFGLQRFHYNTTQIKALLLNNTQLKFGIGIHERQPEAGVHDSP